MERVSGDIYQVFTFGWFGRPIRWAVYRYSWIVDAPAVSWSRCSVEITGMVRFWTGTHPATQVRIVIPWSSFTPAGPAEVTFTETGSTISRYSCDRKSDCFRSLQLEIDVCDSVNSAPLLPNYNTGWHDLRPTDLPARILSIEEAYRETGVCVTINPTHTVIDDSADEFTRWSPAELHDAMETYYSQFAGTWPRWAMWGLLAGTFDSPSVGGIMFDAAGAYGGAGEPPERQGFAVFRDHSWFDNLVAGTPADQDQAWAMRHFLYTWVHEAGHAFNLLHSWNKGRPDSLSWMNYDWRYDQRNGADSFWGDFRFRFDDEEVIHIRHGDRASVIMGGDPWASGGHLEEPSQAMVQVEGSPPLELLVRSQGHFEFMEPVTVELRLRNLHREIPINVDKRLNPEFGGVLVYIQRPDGRILEYAPLLCKLGEPEILALKPAAGSVQGEDRYSESIFLNNGVYGFYFDVPGEYLLRAVYQGAGDVLVVSDAHRIRIGGPWSADQDRLAQDFFTYEVGLNLYFGGSQSPYLSKGMDALQEIVSRFGETRMGAAVASATARGVARPFFRIRDYREPVLSKTHKGDPNAALRLTVPALKLYRQEKGKSVNLPHHDLVRQRCEFLVATGQPEKAKQEAKDLIGDLSKRDVNKPVLDAIKKWSDAL